jgi:mannosyltransferase OCH1-like enzyme
MPPVISFMESLPSGALDVHTLWIGKSLPEWVSSCVASYARTGHNVNWWRYPEERDPEQKTKDEVANANIVVRDANEIVRYEIAKGMYFYGMGSEGKWEGWAPFSDLFRYAVIAQYGGWWVDADAVSVRSLADFTGSEAIVCTERRLVIH